jgi:hypothetical protein
MAENIIVFSGDKEVIGFKLALRNTLGIVDQNGF